MNRSFVAVCLPRRIFKDKMNKNWLLIVIKLLGIIPLIFCVTIPYSDPLRCSNSHYFQFSSLRCRSCPQYMNRSTDGLSCVCKSNFYFVQNGGGGDYKVSCSACSSNEITAQDGWSCVRKPASGACNTSTAIFDKDRDGQKFPDNMRICALCANGTQPDTQRASCKRCHSNVIRLTTSQSGLASCQCPTADSSHGGICFAKATVDKYKIPDVADTYQIRYGQQSISSLFFTKNLIATTVLCCEYHNLTACQLLGNLCVLLHYNKDKSEAVTSSTDACKEFLRISTGQSDCNTQLSALITNGWREFMPWLYYSETGDVALASTDIGTGYQKGQKLRFVVAMYTPNGTFVGVENDTAVFHLCQERDSKLASAFAFLLSYKVTCTIPVSKMLVQRMLFYDLYFYVGDRLYPVPILVQNYQNKGGSVNSGTDRRQWVLTRRFYTVDNIGGKTQENQPPSVISYAQSIQLVISLRNSNGQIYPPYLRITYGTASTTAASVSVSFSSTYDMSTATVTQNVKIAIGVLSAFGVVFAFVRIISWRKRNDKLYLDCSSIFHFIIFTCSALSAVFFAVVAVTCVQWLLFFKQQTVVYRVLPSASQDSLLRAFLISGFILKILDILYILYSQIFVDVFFIDWERPRGRIENPVGQMTNEGNIPVSIIRTLFVANEWREIQTIRRIKPTLQLMLVLFFLKVAGFEHLTTTDPVSRFSVNPSTDYVGEVSFVLRFAVTAIVFVCVAIGQWLFFGLVYERFVSDAVEDFVDFCSISNISIFLLTHDNFGYYIHGRSVHGRSDTSLRELYENFKREEDSLCDKRGLEPDSDCQTFEVFLPSKFRAHYEKITDVLGTANQQRQMGRGAMPPSVRGAGGLGEPKLSASLERSVLAYSTLNKFLASFVEHSSTDFDYVVKDKLLLERLLDMELTPPIDKGFFYKDDTKSFTSALLYGAEWSLLLFDILLFAVVDMAASNYILAAAITYFVDIIITTARDSLGKKNLARKTLVHERFLI